VRYLTYLTQEIEPYNSSKLVYAFQGLTHDGQFLIAAYFPISATLLAPDPSAVDKAERDRFKQDFASYTAQTASALELPGYETTPSLAALDAMLSSLHVSSNPLGQLAATPTTSAATGEGSATEPLNLRSGPGRSFRRIGQLRPGERVELTGRSSDGQWLRIRSGTGLSGWVSMEYIATGSELDSLPVIE
jgi:hypothetical protein